MICFACKQCGRQDQRPEEQSGSLVFCACGQPNRVPWESTAAPEPARTSAPAGPRQPWPEEDSANPPRRRTSADDKVRRRDPSYCFNHQETAAGQQCTTCGQSFCPACVVSLEGQTLCGPCKNFRIRGLLRPGKESGAAIVAIILGLIAAPAAFFLTMIPLGVHEGVSPTMATCCVLGLVAPIAAGAFGIKAVLDMKDDRRLRGRSLAVIGLVAALASFLWCASMLGVTLFRLATD